MASRVTVNVVSVGLQAGFLAVPPLNCLASSFAASNACAISTALSRVSSVSATIFC